MTGKTTEDIAYLNRMREEIAAAENAPHDLETLRRHAAPELVLMPEGMTPVAGRDRALDLMRQLWSVFDVATNYRSEEVTVVGETAIDRGWAREILTDKVSGEVVENLFNYLWISRRDERGVWKQTHVIWNRRGA
jgi:ketosteroid isomerase-like protein